MYVCVFACLFPVLFFFLLFFLSFFEVVFCFCFGGVFVLVWFFGFVLFYGKQSKFPLGRPQRGEGVAGGRGREKETLMMGGEWWGE